MNIYYKRHHPTSVLTRWTPTKLLTPSVRVIICSVTEHRSVLPGKSTSTSQSQCFTTTTPELELELGSPILLSLMATVVKDRNSLLVHTQAIGKFDRTSGQIRLFLYHPSLYTFRHNFYLTHTRLLRAPRRL